MRDAMRIGVDIDEVLVAFAERLLPFFNERHGRSLTTADFTSYDFPKVTGLPLSECIETVRLWVGPKSETTMELVPYPDAKPALEKLKAHGHELSVVTGRHSFSHEATKRWIAREFPGIFEEIFFIAFRGHDGDTTSKADVCKRHGLGILIDDDPHYIDECRAKGIAIILPAQPWNASVRDDDGVYRSKGWDETVRIVEKIAHTK